MISTKKPTSKFMDLIWTLISICVGFFIGAIIGIQGIIALALLYISYQLYKKNKLLEKNLKKRSKKKA